MSGSCGWPPQRACASGARGQLVHVVTSPYHSSCMERVLSECREFMSVGLVDCPPLLVGRGGGMAGCPRGRGIRGYATVEARGPSIGWNCCREESRGRDAADCDRVDHNTRIQRPTSCGRPGCDNPRHLARKAHDTQQRAPARSFTCPQSWSAKRCSTRAESAGDRPGLGRRRSDPSVAPRRLALHMLRQHRSVPPHARA